MEVTMHTEPRTGQIDRIYLHTNEGPQGYSSALNLADYLTRISAGYHVIVDEYNTVVCASDGQVVWAEGGDNSHALSICMIGYSASNDWNSTYSQRMVERAAQQVATWCKAYNVPVTRVRPGWPGQAPTDRGIAGHVDDNHPASGGHTDPGVGFPWASFGRRVQAIIHPPVERRLVEWQHRCAVTPLHLGDINSDVVILKELLTGLGYHVEPGTLYGVHVAEAVTAFKSKAGLNNRDGTVVGGDAAQALVTLVHD